uniref:Ninja-family protein n=1 Tax=Kalanchoe fedtschenkoi TaxID=63787 RepID=A0A7N0ZWU4_KALFE
MGEANEGGGRGGSSREAQSWHLNKYPKDLLQKLMPTTSSGSLGLVKREEDIEVEDSDDLELNLGLSLGGRFGVDKHQKLVRSSSIATTLPVVRDEDVSAPSQTSYPTIVRTSSLPAETEEEWRKRKELQTLRRLEAKRRRSEKQKGTNLNPNSNSNPNSNPSLERSLEEARQEVEGAGGANLRDKQYMISALANYKSGSWVGQPFGLPNWAKRGGGGNGGGADLNGKGKGGGGLLLRANSGFGQQRDSQGSVESQGGSSSGLSDFDTKSIQGTSSAGEAKSSGTPHEKASEEGAADPAKAQSAKNSCRTPTSGSAENPSKRPDSRSKGKQVSANGMGDMPCVFTTGDGPNGRRIDGILYKYGKGEEVRIMCVCHGIFLSPAEFVKHAGGTDVDHPLRHIVVNTSATSFT